MEPGGTGGNPFCKVSWRGRRLSVGRSGRKRRLKCHVLHDALIRAGVVVDAISRAHHGVAQRFPCQAEAGSEIVAVGTHQRHGKLTVVRPGLAHLHRDRRRSKAHRQVQVHNAIVQFRERRNVFVAHAEIQCEVAAQAPFILYEQVPGIAPEVIVVVAKLDRSQLRKPQQEVGKVVTGVHAGKGESSAGVAVGLGVDLNPPEISAPAPGVLAAAVDQAVGKRPGLVAQQLRIGVVEAAKMRERQVGQAPVKRICGDAGYAEISRDVLVKGVKVLRADAGAIEIEARVVDHLAKGPHISDGNVEAAGAGVAAHAGKGIGQVRAGGVVVEAETQIISRAALSPPAAAGAGSAQGVVQSNIKVVAVVEGRGNKMKIRLVGSRIRDVGQGDERQEP